MPKDKHEQFNDDMTKIQMRLDDEWEILMRDCATTPEAAQALLALLRAVKDLNTSELHHVAEIAFQSRFNKTRDAGPEKITANVNDLLNNIAFK